MQVKKFEARSMKEALQLVKGSMGPEAIILSMRDINNGFGIAGGTSVEVTAAVSEQTLRKKRLAQAKLNSQHKEIFESSSARQQKDFIDKVVSKLQREHQEPSKITATPYIDIKDDKEPQIVEDFIEEDSNLSNKGGNAHVAKTRIKSAAKEALKAAYFVNDEVEKVEPTVATTTAQEGPGEIASLKRQIQQLQQVIANFKSVPQTFLSMHPGASEGIPYELSFMFEKLTRAGMSIENSKEILKYAKDYYRKKGVGRPTKKDRRDIDDFTDKNE